MKESKSIKRRKEYLLSWNKLKGKLKYCIDCDYCIKSDSLFRCTYPEFEIEKVNTIFSFLWIDLVTGGRIDDTNFNLPLCKEVRVDREDCSKCWSKFYGDLRPCGRKGIYFKSRKGKTKR